MDILKKKKKKREKEFLLLIKTKTKNITIKKSLLKKNITWNEIKLVFTKFNYKNNKNLIN